MMMLRSGRLTGTRGIFETCPDGMRRWSLYIKPSEQKEAEAMLRGEIPIQVDEQEMNKWLNDPNRDDRPSPQDIALARTMCIAAGQYRGITGWGGLSFEMKAQLGAAHCLGHYSSKCDISMPLCTSWDCAWRRDQCVLKHHGLPCFPS